MYIASTMQTFMGQAPPFTASHPRTWCANPRVEIDQEARGSGFSYYQSANWGIVFRYQDASNYYYYKVSEGPNFCRSYSLSKVVNGQSTNLLPGGCDSRLGTARHTLFVTAKGDQITVGVVQNGIDLMLGAVQDASLTAGYSGMRDSINYRSDGIGAYLDVFYYRFAQRPVQ